MTATASRNAADRNAPDTEVEGTPSIVALRASYAVALSTALENQELLPASGGQTALRVNR
jgi:hypothetical protein